MLIPPIRVAIAGAVSEPAYALVFRIAAGGLFGPDRPVSLSVCDAPSSLPKLEALAIELDDCAFPLLADVRTGHDLEDAFDGAEWIVLLGGRAYEPDLGRMDMLRANTPLFVKAGRAANAAAPRARVLNAVHPANTGCLIGSRHAPNMPSEHWMALNRNVRMRATILIAQKAGVPVHQVHRVTIWGNHSEQMYVDAHNALIDGKPADVVIADEEWVHRILPGEVIGRSFRVLSLRGGWPSETIAQAILGTIRSLTQPTAQSRWFGAGVISDGSYGVPRGLFFGFPLTTVDGRKWAIEQGLYIDRYALDRLAADVFQLQHEAAIADSLIGSEII